MHAILLADWTTISADGGAGVSKVTSLAQASSGWLDVGDAEDLTFLLDVREVTGAVTMSYETSPAKDDASFVAMVKPFTLAVGTRAHAALFTNAVVPAARFVRWRLSNPGGSGTWDATFRLWVSTSSPGGR